MKKLLILLFISVTISVFSQDSYVEKPLTFNSAKILAVGNTFVANANGLEAFEFNPAGLSDRNSVTFFSGNMNFIANFFQLGDDLIDVYNSDPNTTGDADKFLDTNLAYFLDPENRANVIDALLNQVSTPYGDQLGANGLGFTSSMSTGFTLGGIGIGLLFTLDSEVYGEERHNAELTNVLTTALLLGYSLDFDLGIVGVSAGIGVRPMYKIRSNTGVESVVTFLTPEEDRDPDFDLYDDLTFLTGMGVGVDLGVKAHAFGLTAGIAVIDIMGTEIFYSENSISSIRSGDYLGESVIDDQYIVPATLKLGLAYNPEFGNLGKALNPSISLDYNLYFVDNATVQEYAYQGNFWTNLSLGAEVDLFSVFAIRAGLNQGYATFGLGLDIFILELDAAIYSKELGEEVGERQQMGFVLEFALRI